MADAMCILHKRKENDIRDDTPDLEKRTKSFDSPAKLILMSYNKGTSNLL